MRTALCIAYSQITEGEASCTYCADDATVTVATGADPEPVPTCWTHARMMFGSSLTLGDRLFGGRPSTPERV